MMNYSDLFCDNYSYYLESINYKVVTVGPVKDKVDIHFKDHLAFEIIDESSLKIIVKRTVFFEPNVVYELSVSYGAILTFKQDIKIEKTFNWEQEFKQNLNGSILIQGLLSRISLQIAQITSSYGNNPIVTPPNLIEN